ncbi:MAG: DNA translocase FtsK 4TM domain-containing protein, partial [Flavobacteriales bacterium]|nr:DNA translocase FtsK 4TM domain-containing protein [Flavobacteriales bacterium]
MRNQLKTDKPKSTKKTKKELNLNPFKKINLSFLDFHNNEKLNKITGLTLLLSSAYLLIAFTSFLFTWRTDQDKLFGSWWELIIDNEIIVDNWLGKFGAIISHQFMHEWFGISSFGFVLLTFILGFKILFKFNILPIKTTFKHTLFNVVWVSAFLGYLFHDSLYFLGGSFGYQTHLWLSGLVGHVGTGFLLFFLLLGFAVLNFNISFDWMKNIFLSQAEKDLQEETTREAESKVINLNSDFVDIVPEDKPVTVTNGLEIDQQNDSSTKVDSEIELESELSIEIPEIKKKEASSELEIEATIPEPMVIESPPDSGIPAMAVEDTTEQDDTLTDKEVDKKLEDFGEYDPTLDLGHYNHPTIDLLDDHGDGQATLDKEAMLAELETNKNRIVETLNNYSIKIAKIKATVGPTITLYEIVPAAGVRISKIKNLEDDIALSLAALGIRIIAPIPGKGTIGIEVPNSKPDVVSMRTCIASEKFQNAKMELPCALGKTIQNETFVVDLAKMPHLLMAGATGQGKSVGLNAILTSLLYKKHPSQLKFVMIDPKMVELSIYNKIEKHFLAKLPDTDKPILTDSKKVTNTLNSLVIEMENRLKLCEKASARNIIEYNTKFIKRKLNPENGHKFLPYIVVVIDEFADFIMEAGKEIETPIARLAQKARAIGIHLIVATQRPSANVITGIIKANFPARVAFRVSSKIDSRVILDAGGADQLIGRGDMLYSGGQDMVRIQCAFVDTPEVERIVNFIGDQQGYPETFELPEYVDENAGGGASGLADDERDVLFEDAARTIVMHQQGSASLLQRKMKLGYNRAGRLIDQLEAAGIVGQHEGSKARQVLIPDEYSLEQYLTHMNNNTE